MEDNGLTPFDRLMAGKNGEKKKSVLDGAPNFTVSGANGEVYNGYVIPAKSLSEADGGGKKHTGVYFFIVKKTVTRNGEEKTYGYVYVGQSKDLGSRIQKGNHDHVKGLNEDDRKETIVVASSGFDLSKDQREYIEARIFDMACASRHYIVLTDRVNVSDSPKKKKEELEAFLKNLAGKLKTKATTYMTMKSFRKKMIRGHSDACGVRSE